VRVSKDVIFDDTMNTCVTQELAEIIEENDPLGIRKQTVLLLFRAKISSHMQKVEISSHMLLDRGSAYRVTSSMCSPQLNVIHIVDSTFGGQERPTRLIGGY
jgi:hypothetical protein